MYDYFLCCLPIINKMRFSLEYLGVKANRFQKPEGKINIRNNSNISDLKREGEDIDISFTFTTRYEPQVGEIEIKGQLHIRNPDENIQQAVNDWEEGGKDNLDPQFAKMLHNTILTHCVVEATLLSKEVMLPPPTKVPQVKLEEEKEKEQEKQQEKQQDQKEDDQLEETRDYIR